MLNNLRIAQFTIVILAKNHNPTIINPDFLRVNNIVPANWELDKPIFTLEELSQVIYTNGVSIVAQTDRVTFSQFIPADYTDSDIFIPGICNSYITVLPHVNYSGFGINFTGHILTDSVNEQSQYMLDFLLRSGDWKYFRGVHPNPYLTLVYNLDDCKITVSISPALVKDEDSGLDSAPVILFQGNFDRDISPGSGKIEILKSKISDWKSDLSSYVSLVQSHLLPE